MRLAIIMSNRRLVGGVASYLASVIPALVDRQHEIGVWCELDQPDSAEPIPIPAGSATWCVAELGEERALASLAEWHPDLLFAHGLKSPRLERRTLEIAPAVFFIHGYYGTCISGAKTFKYPTTIPCSRRFGWPCLLHYYPHHCGGWSPQAMWRGYRTQSERSQLLPAYEAICTHSDHMRQEFINHGFTPDRVVKCTHYIEAATTVPRATRTHPGWRVLFLGRMDHLKGGHVLLEAVPSVARALDRPLRLTFAGDGPARASWEARAARLRERHPQVDIEFTGWLPRAARDQLLSVSDLLVVPSLWPEPFGQVGAEAGFFGLPAAAFRVGGIPEWLDDGVNGHLAPGDPPTAAGLADAICNCLRDRDTYEELSAGARRLAARFTLDAHLSELLPVLEKVVRAAKASDPTSPWSPRNVPAGRNQVLR